jgi:hypothetical protein
MATKPIPIELTKDIGSAVHALAKSAQSIIDDDDLDKGEKASWLKETFAQYQKYMSELIPAGIRKAVAAAVEVAKIKSTAAADDPADDLFPQGKKPLFFNASGYGPMHQKLWILFDNIRRQKGGYTQDGSAFQEAWASLSDAEKQAVRDEEKQAEDAREAKADAEAKERQRQMNKSELINLSKRVVDGIDTATTHDTLYNAAKSVAAADRQDGETAEMARARFWQSPDGKVVYNALKVAKVGDVEDRPSHVAKLGPGMLALHKRADEIRQGTTLSRAQAVAKIATTPAEAAIWRAAKAEQLEQVS